MDNSTNETGFEIERSDDGNTFTLITTEDANTTTYKDPNLTANTQYYYRIRAVGPAGESGYSNIVNATTGVIVLPAAPSNLSATATSSSTIMLSWADNSTNETGFEIERSGDGTNFSLIFTAAPDATNHTDDNLQAKTTYYYRLKAAGTEGSSAYSNIANATTPEMVKPALRPGNILSPNGDGYNDRWVVGNIDKYPDNKVEVFDQAGRLVYSKTGYTNDWNGMVNGHVLAEGTYYYRITFQSDGKKEILKGFISFVKTP